MKLDRDRYYALVYGDPVKKYYQDSTFYNGLGEEVGKSTPPPQVEEDEEPPIVVEQKVKSSDLELLQGMHISKLKKLAVKLSEAETSDSLPEMKGRGLKNRLIAYIAGNTE